jgi:hypothetical protein
MKKDEFGTDLFEIIVDVLWENRKQLQDEDFYFDYPEYGGLPDRISDRLSSHAVDIIQETYNPYDMKDVKRKATWRNMLLCAAFPMAWGAG